MKKNSVKRICLLVAALMALTLFPMASLAFPLPSCKIGSTEYLTIQAAVAAAPTGGAEPTIITLLRDVEETVTGNVGLVIQNKKITFALGAFNLTITNADANSIACYVQAEPGETSSLSYTGTGSFDVVGSNYGLYVSSWGDSLTATATAKITNVTGSSDGSYAAVRVDSDSSSSSATVGNVTQTGEGSYGVLVYGAGSSITVNGDITANNLGGGIIVNSGQATVNGNITASTMGIMLVGNGTLTMTGNVTAGSPNAQQATGIMVAKGTATVNGKVTSPIGVLAELGCLVVINGSMETTIAYIVFGSEFVLDQEDVTVSEGGYKKYIATGEDGSLAVWVGMPASRLARERVYTYEPAAITGSGASLSGGIGGLDASRVTEYGFVLSTDVNPILGGAGTLKVNAPSTDFMALATGLKPATTYYVRAYVVADGATYYGNVLSFVTGGTADVSVPNTGDGTGFVPFLALGAALLLSAYALTLKKRA